MNDDVTSVAANPPFRRKARRFADGPISASSPGCCSPRLGWLRLVHRMRMTISNVRSAASLLQHFSLVGLAPTNRSFEVLHPTMSLEITGLVVGVVRRAEVMT